MNLILLFEDDFTGPGHVLLTGRRLRHVTEVHRASPGDRLTVGVAGGRIGRGTVVRLDPEALEMTIELEREPPPRIPLTLFLSLPRPKALNRVIQTVASLGIQRMVLMNSWRVEKSFWDSPRLGAANIREQLLLGLEQARDTILPEIEIRRRFRPFVEDEVPALAEGTMALVAHPAAPRPCPRDAGSPVTLAIGPEGGFIASEIALFEAAGFTAVTMGERILRVEAAVPALVSRLF